MVLVSLMLIFSIFILLRGHNLPGGGFIGGLIGAGAFVLHGLAFGSDVVRRDLRIQSLSVAGLGVFLAAVSGLLSAIFERPFLTGLWYFPKLGLETKVGLSTPLLFDIGVYLVVVGALVTIVLALEEAD
jgi:multicomponent Na+:H+ antiporter subunit B